MSTKCKHEFMYTPLNDTYVHGRLFRWSKCKKCGLVRLENDDDTKKSTPKEGTWEDDESSS